MAQIAALLYFNALKLNTIRLARDMRIKGQT